jgi:hypothetical protein
LWLAGAVCGTRGGTGWMRGRWDGAALECASDERVEGPRVDRFEVLWDSEFGNTFVWE